MALLDPVPLPPELAAPTPDADDWAHAVIQYAAELAEADGLDADAVAADLVDHPDNHVDPDNPHGPIAQAARWRITDDGSAEWALRHVAEAEAELDRLGAQAADWAERINAWFQHQAKPLLAKRAFFSAHLERYALEARAADPKRKSVVLPSGVVQTRVSNPRVQVADPEQALAWAKVHDPDAVKVAEDVQVSKLGHAKVAELVTEAWVTYSCGCIATPHDHADGLTLLAVGTATECPECGNTDVLVGRIDIIGRRWVAVDDNGNPVPGLAATEPTVTAKVVPAP